MDSLMGYDIPKTDLEKQITISASLLENIKNKYIKKNNEKRALQKEINNHKQENIEYNSELLFGGYESNDDLGFTRINNRTIQ